MADNDSTIGRRTALKKVGTLAGGSAALGLAADPAAAMDVGIHDQWAVQVAEDVCAELGHPYELDDNIDVIGNAAREPDENTVNLCEGIDDPDVCDYLETVVQKSTHYRNPDNPTGFAHETAADKAQKARDEATSSSPNWTYVAEWAGRALHHIQDVGTLVHTGYELEQANDRDIHHEFEAWIGRNWDSYFSDGADTGGTDCLYDWDDVKTYTNFVAQNSKDELDSHWWDIEDHESSYYMDTAEAQRDQIEDATYTMRGMLKWIYDGGC